MALQIAKLPLISSPRGGLLANAIWLVFALSFLWFPYIGMLVFPCQEKSGDQRHHSSLWSKYDTNELMDYSKIGECNRSALVGYTVGQQAVNCVPLHCRLPLH